jgi:hypothetical protein
MSTGTSFRNLIAWPTERPIRQPGAVATEVTTPTPTRAIRIADAISGATPWIARVAWVLVAVLGGAAIDSALEGRSSRAGWTAAIGAWAIWGVVALALVIASVRSLTAVRVGAPLALLATLGAGIGGADAVELLALGVPSAIAVGAAMAAEFGRRFVQASAYGDEERFPLRMPVAAGTAAVLAWTLWAPAVIVGPLLLAARAWVAGGVVSVTAVAAAILLAPRWHRLSRRWFVLVPAGVVLHDPVVLADTLALRTGQIAHLGLAPADTTAADLTGPASGYAVEVATTVSVTTVFAFTPSEPNGRAIHLTAFLAAPSRPGAMLRAARRRGLPVR